MANSEWVIYSCTKNSCYQLFLLKFCGKAACVPLSGKAVQFPNQILLRCRLWQLKKPQVLLTKVMWTYFAFYWLSGTKSGSLSEMIVMLKNHCRNINLVGVASARHFTALNFPLELQNYECLFFISVLFRTNLHKLHSMTRREAKE